MSTAERGCTLPPAFLRDIAADRLRQLLAIAAADARPWSESFYGEPRRKRSRIGTSCTPSLAGDPMGSPYRFAGFSEGGPMRIP